ncbi:hypothetical protein [Paludibacter jiangxiensis]|nr:hypothetical protein [Paludibacter jiangxiensis]
MISQTTLGNLLLPGVCSFEISENILEMSNTAKIIIPKEYGKLAGKSVLDYLKVGQRVEIQAGYNGELYTEFIGYIREIGADAPITIECDDETYVLRKPPLVKSYKSVTLRQLLTDIIPKPLTFSCPDVHLGKYQIDNASAFAVLQDLIQHFGLYCHLQNGHLRVGLAFDFGEKALKSYTYYLNDPERGNIKKNELKYKRAEDYDIRIKAIAMAGTGKSITVTVGSKEKNASERTLHFAGQMTEAQLRDLALGTLKKLVFDGYTGSITGFGFPTVHAGDSLTIFDKENKDREGKFLVEKVDITYNDTDGYSRKCTLNYKIK